jgi:SIR2-like protein
VATGPDGIAGARGDAAGGAGDCRYQVDTGRRAHRTKWFGFLGNLRDEHLEILGASGRGQGGDALGFRRCWCSSLRSRAADAPAAEPAPDPLSGRVVVWLGEAGQGAAAPCRCPGSARLGVIEWASMWIREVDFPAALIGAHRSGKMVIFVGAGASRDAPASLPDFRTLTTTIAAEAQAPVTETDLAQLDVFLGRLEDRKFDVHRRVFAHIEVATSKPNRLHKALVDLAASAQPVRIVTTNYDLHLSTVLEQRDINVDEFVGPALPMGDDFTGVVYLHGSLRQQSRRLVVTDGDFGRAYLRDAWAARFLERMFATYTVLFVGYSHSDVVMRYLARALGPGAPRYVLTSSPDEPDWHALGVHPIGYPVSGGSHVALVDAVEGWATQASMGLLEHRQRIAQLVSAAPSKIPEEVSYMEAVVADADQARLFSDLARGQEWLTWAIVQPEFRRLFDGSAETMSTTPQRSPGFVSGSGSLSISCGTRYSVSSSSLYRRQRGRTRTGLWPMCSPAPMTAAMRIAAPMRSSMR